MSLYFSKSKNSFYDDSINQSSQIPLDAVQITEVEHQSLLDAQSMGQVITSDANGNPVAVTQASLMTLAQVQAAQIVTLSADCQAQIYAGFQSSALGAAHTYPAKDKDQANLTASYASSFDPTNPAGWTTPFWVMDSTGSWTFVQHTAAQIQQAGRDGKAAITAALEKNATLSAQVMAATTVAAVQAIIW